MGDMLFKTMGDMIFKTMGDMLYKTTQYIYACCQGTDFSEFPLAPSNPFSNPRTHLIADLVQVEHSGSVDQYCTA